MRKLLFLLVFIPLVSFSQVIVHKEWINRDNNKFTLKEINITEIQDEYIEIKLFVKKDVVFSSASHLLITSEYKNVLISASWKEKKWNVYDGDKLISLRDKIDVLNYFNKYGFEYLETNTKSSGSSTTYMPDINYSITFSKSKSSIVLKNNNN